MNNLLSKSLFGLILVALGIGSGFGVRYFFFPTLEAPRFINDTNFQETRTELETKVSEDSQNPAPHQELAFFLFNYYPYAQTGSEALSSSKEHFQHALDLIPTQTGTDALRIADVYFKLGNLEREQKNFPESITLFEKGLEFQPENADIKFNIAFTYLDDIKDFNKAEEWMLKIGDTLSQDPAFHYNFAKIYFAQEKFEAAETALQITMQLDPKNASIVRGDFFKRVLEAQGKELPEDADVPIIDAEFSKIPDYKITYKVDGYRYDGGDKFYVLIDKIDLSNNDFKNEIKQIIKDLVSEKGGNISIDIYDDKNTLETAHRKNIDLEILNNEEYEKESLHFIAGFSGELETGVYLNTLYFFPGASNDHKQIGKYVEIIEFNL